MPVRSIIFAVLAILLLAISGYWRTQLDTPQPATVLAAIQQNTERELLQLESEAKSVIECISKNKEWPALNYVFVLSDSARIVKWSTHHYFPEPTIFSADTIGYWRTGSNHYLFRQWALPKAKYLTGYIELYNGYPVQNQYLTPYLNNHIFPDAGVGLDASGDQYVVKINNKNLFTVSINPGFLAEIHFEWLSWILFLAGVLCLFFFVRAVVRQLLKHKQGWIATALVFLALLMVRLIMVYGKFPGNETGLTIFDPKQFASSTFNDSIGNLLLNTIAFFISGLCAFYFLKEHTWLTWRRKPRGVKIVVTSLVMVMCFAFQLLPFLYLETIYHNSAITPDISQQIYFDGVRWCALGCLILSSLTGFYFFFTFFRAAVRVTLSDAPVYFASVSIAALAGFMYHLFTDRHYEIPLVLTFLHLTILFIGTVTNRLRFISSRILSLFLLALVMFSLQAALTIRMLTMERQREAMLKFDASFLIERDILGEYLLDQAILKIENDTFIQQQLINPFNGLSGVIQKIKHNHLNTYFDRYDTRIYIFDNRGQPVNSELDKDLSEIIRDFAPLAEGTGYRGMYMITNPGQQFLKRYLAVVPIKFRVTNYVVLDLTLRHVLPVTVFPKVLLDSRFSSYSNSSTYSFAIFKNDTLVNSSGAYNYLTGSLIKNIKNPDLYSAGVLDGDYVHVAIKDQNGQVAVVSATNYSLFQVMTNFSFYFLVGLIIVLIALSLMNLSALRNISLTYSERIQLYVYLAVVLPLLAIATTTLRVNAISDEQRLQHESTEQANRIVRRILPVLIEQPETLPGELLEQAQGTGIDVTLFSKSGTLLASSQPDIFSNQLVSRFINPIALSEIRAGNFLFTLDDEIGKLSFRNTYAAVLSPVSGDVLGILSLPFFESQESTEKNQIRLISNILSVFVLVLLFFYLISFFAVNWLTAPLRIMAATLKRTTWAGLNRKLNWSSKDEMGTLVNEYNKMIDNLEKSREELEKRQREASWREMARQVAHEIKNPLTPIKLILQQIEKKLKEGSAEPGKTIDSVKSVLQHVDILNDIASSFSAFAQMPELKLERLDIKGLLKDTVSLFANSSDGSINFDSDGDALMVMADRKLFTRIFSNIILNALQSSSYTVEVDIKIESTTESCLIAISDNGAGIAPDVVNKIFIPYFSTKQTGSGLGLAIAKQGIEQIGGRIWCESQLEKGTTFHISLPLRM